MIKNNHILKKNHNYKTNEILPLRFLRYTFLYVILKFAFRHVLTLHFYKVNILGNLHIIIVHCVLNSVALQKSNATYVPMFWIPFVIWLKIWIYTCICIYSFQKFYCLFFFIAKDYHLVPKKCKAYSGTSLGPGRQPEVDLWDRVGWDRSKQNC